MTQSLPANTPFPADWYDDPHAPGGRVKRYWDGVAWTDFVYDLGIDFAVPAPGPTSDRPATVTRLHALPEQPEAAVVAPSAEEVLAVGDEDVPARKIRRCGARKAARQLAQENLELQRQMSELSATVARYEAALERIQPGTTVTS